MNLTIQLLIQHESTIYFPDVEKGVQLALQRKGSPGKLTFSVVKDEALVFEEGDPVKLTVNDTVMFYGFVFKKKETKADTIAVTAYDQMRYLKNKDTYVEGKGLTASDLLKRIATDFRLNLGTVEDTGYKIVPIDYQNKTLFDMILDSVADTCVQTGNLYTLYDNGGKLCLQNINTMRLNILIDASSGENFEYTSSIDDQTYTKVKLAYENKDSGKRELYVTQDGENINKWGVLQYYEDIQTQEGASAKADALLQYYDMKTRNLKLTNIIGNPEVRAGCTIAVRLTLNDMTLDRWMMVESVTHNIGFDEHFMDLQLIGGEFIA